jgi:hypothetical protein
VFSVVRNLSQGTAKPKTDKCDSRSMRQLYLSLNCVYCRFIMRRVPMVIVCCVSSLYQFSNQLEVSDEKFIE